MKIESPLAFINIIRNTNPTKNVFEFECLMDTKNHTRNDDDFYWQHQDQLQHSELTFKSDSRLHPSNLSTREKEVNNDIMEQSSKLPSASDAVSIFSNKENPTLESVTLSNELLNVLINQIKTKSEPTNCLLAERPIIMQTNKAVTIPITRKIENNIINENFKNYQLFLNGKHVELTLNTTLFSKQEIQDLRLLIKQWLTQKNYTLKQLVINGESQ